MSETGLIVVGDVHGDHLRLSALLERLAGREERIVFVGDYVNRGPGSREVIETLLRFTMSRERTHFLCGNHDRLFLDYLDGGDFAAFARAGGLATVRSYIPGPVRRDVREHLREAVPGSHKAFLAGLEPYWENDEYLVSHVGFDPAQPSDRSFRTMVLDDHPGLFRLSDEPAKPAVFGHYVQQGEVYMSRRIVCVDTGCGLKGGTLSAVVLPERSVITV